MYVAACGPRARKCWQTSVAFGCEPQARQWWLSRNDAVRAAWMCEGGDCCPAYAAWQMAAAWRQWRRRTLSHDPTAVNALAQESEEAARVESSTIGRRLVLTRLASARARNARTARDLAVAAGLADIFAKVDATIASAAAQGCAMFGSLVAACDAAEAGRRAKAQRKATRLANEAALEEERRRPFVEGLAADSRGYHAVERFLHVRRRRGVTELLVRWVGDHPDEWVRQTSLEPSVQQEAARWARHVLGYVRSGQVRTVRQPHARFRRLLRGEDVGLCVTSLVKRARGAAAFYDFSDERPRKCTRVLEPPSEMDLRGETWRQEEAAEGRAPKRRRL